MKIILKKPIMTEKSTRMAKEGSYTFLVDKSARKGAIKKAVEDQFGVKVISVKTINVKSRTRLQRARRGYFEIPGYKKALVALKKGQKIDLFIAEEIKEDKEQKEEVKEKKSLFRGTKVRIEKSGKGKGEK